MDERLDLLKTEVSLVLPAYNEADRIEHAVDEATKHLREISDAYEIILAEDGSTDGTDGICRALTARYIHVRHLHSDTKLGRGRALKNAFKASQGSVVGYMDADLSTDPSHLEELIDNIRMGFDLATGSRMMGGYVKRKPTRMLLSYGYNLLVRLFLGSMVKDHQCGFKAFDRRFLEEILDEVEDTHWFWDTEILVRAQRGGYRVKEFPVRWRRSGASKVKTSDVIKMGWKVLRLRMKLKKASRRRSPHSSSDSLDSLEDHGATIESLSCLTPLSVINRWARSLIVLASPLTAIITMQLCSSRWMCIDELMTL